MLTFSVEQICLIKAEVLLFYFTWACEVWFGIEMLKLLCVEMIMNFYEHSHNFVTMSLADPFQLPSKFGEGPQNFKTKDPNDP